jgi:hypothetical protein
MLIFYVSKHLPFHQVNPSHEQGAHPAGHVHCIEQEVADGLVPVKAITASSTHSASAKILKIKNCTIQPKKKKEFTFSQISGPLEFWVQLQ